MVFIKSGEAVRAPVHEQTERMAMGPRQIFSLNGHKTNSKPY
jgi:hypothetical protein